MFCLKTWFQCQKLYAWATEVLLLYSASCWCDRALRKWRVLLISPLTGHRLGLSCWLTCKVVFRTDLVLDGNLWGPSEHLNRNLDESYIAKIYYVRRQKLQKNLFEITKCWCSIYNLLYHCSLDCRSLSHNTNTKLFSGEACTKMRDISFVLFPAFFLFYPFSSFSA